MTEQELQQPNSPNDAPAMTKSRSKFARVIDVLLWVMIVVLAAAVLVRVFLFTQIRIDGVSMTCGYYGEENSATYDPNLTFHHNDVVSVSKVKQPRRGDVVVFYEQEGNNKFFDLFSSRTDADSKNKKIIKRVVALGGDKIWVEKVDGCDDLYMVMVQTADGQTLREDGYVLHGETLAMEAFFIDDTDISDLGKLRPHVGEQNALVISEDCFFALGDNRSNSSDSRIFGEMPLSRIFGVVVDA